MLSYSFFFIDNKDRITVLKRKKKQAIYIKIDPCLNTSSPCWYGNLQLHMCSINSFQYFFATKKMCKYQKFSQTEFQLLNYSVIITKSATDANKTL